MAESRAAVVAAGGLYVANLMTHGQTSLDNFGLDILQIALPRKATQLVVQAREPLQAASDLVAFSLP